MSARAIDLAGALVLTGTLGEPVAGGVVVRASDAEVAAFASPGGRGAPVVAQYQPRPGTSAVPDGFATEILYNRHGEPVVYVSGVALECPRVEVTSFRDTERQFFDGPPELRVDVKPMPGVTVERLGTLRRLA